MKHLVSLFIVFLTLSACSGGLTSEELASLAAKGYYEHLVNGEYDSFLEGKAGADSLPEAYRSQLLDGYKQFMSQQESLHRGIHDVRVASAQTDTLLHYVNVFLVLCFGDSTNEQVAVPMVETNGTWRMR